MTECRLVAALPLAGIVGFGACRARSLTASGALAAAVFGAFAVAAGWPWAMVLTAYFALAAALSRLGRAHKEKLTSSIVDKHGARDAWQEGQEPVHPTQFIPIQSLEKIHA